MTLSFLEKHTKKNPTLKPTLNKIAITLIYLNLKAIVEYVLSKGDSTQDEIDFSLQVSHIDN